MVSISGLTEFNTTARNKVLSVRGMFDAGLLQLKLPIVDSTSNLGLNVLGKSVIQVVDGEYFGTKAQQKTFLEEFLSWGDVDTSTGSTVTNRTFTDNMSKTWSVQPIGIDWDDSVQSADQKLIYRITLFRSADPNA